jgi:hypothetical protein
LIALASKKSSQEQQYCFFLDMVSISVAVRAVVLVVLVEFFLLETTGMVLKLRRLVV